MKYPLKIKHQCKKYDPIGTEKIGGVFMRFLHMTPLFAREKSTPLLADKLRTHLVGVCSFTADSLGLGNKQRQKRRHNKKQANVITLTGSHKKQQLNFENV